MSNKLWILTRTLMRASGGANILKYEKDKKKRGKIIGNYVGLALMYLMVMGYCIAVSIGYGYIGLADAIPQMCATMVCALAFLMSLLRANGYLFATKDYGMLMAMPFPARTVVSAKFLSMYLRNLPFIFSCSAAMLIGYGIYVRPPVWVYFAWLVLTAVLLLVPMVIASAIGTLIAAVGSGFRHKNLIQSLLIFASIIFGLLLRFIIESLFENGRAEETLGKMAAGTQQVGAVYLPVKWFSDAVTQGRISSICLLLGISILVYEMAFVLVGRYYRRINSRMRSERTLGNYQMHALKTRSAVRSVAYKEWRRFVGSPAYLTNMGTGQFLVAILSVAVLFLNVDSMIAAATDGAPVPKEILLPAVPVILYFLVGMTTTTAVSWSLEGKSFWIVQSLPVTERTLLRGKMLFNLWVSVPFMAIGCICFGIALQAGIGMIVLFLVCGTALCLMSTTYGMYCGVRRAKLDWEKEIEVIKQGSAVVLYLFPNMLLTIVLVIAAVYLGLRISPVIILLGITAVAVLLAGLFYRLLMRKEKNV